MQHLDEGTIHAWLDGALSSEESARVEQHSRQCAECAAMVADARGLIAGASRIVSALDVVPGGVIPKTKPPVAAPSRPVWRMLHLTPFRAALAASLMVAVGSLFAVRQSSDAKREMFSSDMAVPASAPAPAPTAPPQTPVAEGAPPTARARVRPEPTSERGAAATVGAAKDAATRQERAEKPEFAAAIRVSAPDTTRSVLQLRDSVAPPAVAARAVADQAARMDTTAAKVAQAPTAPASGASANAGGRGGVAGGRALEEARRAPMGLTQVTTTSAAFAPSGDFSGCYRVNTDSLMWPRPLPRRFSLETDTATRQRVFRGLDIAGRVDSAVAGNWRPVGTTAVSVTMNARDQQAKLFVLTRGEGGLTAQRMDGTPVGTIPVTRETCPR